MRRDCRDFAGTAALSEANLLVTEQLDVRDLLRSQSRTQWVIVSTGMFTSFLFEPAFGVVDLAHDTVRALGAWENAVTVNAQRGIELMGVEQWARQNPK